MDPLTLWRRYRQYLCECPTLGLRLDISRIDFDDSFFARMQPQMQRAYAAMADLEAGQIANPDENRMVGHYWLRNAALAPTDQIRAEINANLQAITAFAAKIHSRGIKPPSADRFTDVLLIGIGGSALGPQLIADALAPRRDKLGVHFFDNTDPDGFDRVLESLGTRTKSTLVLVISKSGGTPETRNGMLETRAYFQKRGVTFGGLNFPQQAVAITGVGSQLDQVAAQENWLARFPMWDWVGGRTSVMSAVGLLPAALQGIDIQGLLDGAAEMDQITRQTDTVRNPAALLALMWHQATGGRGAKDMVVLPYKDRLLLLSRYLQQLIMESLGKEKDLAGAVVHQGLSVYGNKGSTDQHAFVQQLRDGLDNFFATFIVVLEDRPVNGAKNAPDVEPGNSGGPGVKSGDYLSGLWQGTRQALYENGRSSLTITLDTLNPRTLGALIALYERAVGFYASLVNINAYHQPGVEAGKRAAAAVLDVQGKVLAFLKQNTEALTPEQIADRMAIPQQVETIHHVLDHLAANRRSVVRNKDKFRYKA